MNFIVSYINFLARYTKNLSVCASVGLMAGAIAGTMLVLLDLTQTNLSLTSQEVIKMSLLLTAFSWIIVLFTLCVFVKFTLRSIALPSFINCLLTCYATVFLSNYWNAFVLAWLIGIIVGILIGMLLCRLNSVFYKITN